MLMCAPAMAYEVHVVWDVEPGADTYKVELSTDLGVSWVVMDDSLTQPDYVAVVPDVGLSLLRASNCSQTAGCTLRPASGVWANPEWSALGAPAEVGVE